VKKGYSHVIFDLDRTLWDFESNARLALADIYKELNLESFGIQSFSSFERTYKRINEDCWDEYRKGVLKKEVLRSIRFKKTLEEFGVHAVKLAEQIGELYLDKSPRLPHLMPGAFSLLDYLKPRYNLHILTNGFVEVQTIKLIKSGLRPYFEHVVASEETGAKKPHPDTFQYTLEKIGCKPNDCIMVGDDPKTDIEGAHAIGMDTVLYDPEYKHQKGLATHHVHHLNMLSKFL
jgi:putative hydrolase of the HAD superfamily